MTMGYVPQEVSDDEYQIFRTLYANYAKSLIWMRWMKNHSLSKRYLPHPLKLVYFDPSNINRMWATNPHSIEGSERSLENISKLGCYILEGNWDKEYYEFEKYDLYDGMMSRIKSNVPWEETRYYQRVLKKVEETGSWKDCYNENQLQQRFEMLDAAIESIKCDGYLTQREANIKYGILKSPPELYEVTVLIGRDGEVYLYDGRHRLSMSKALNIDKIPVRVLGRHQIWFDRVSDKREGEHPDNDAFHDIKEYMFWL